jgi:hypothetical protein
MSRINAVSSSGQSDFGLQAAKTAAAIFAPFIYSSKGAVYGVNAHRQVICGIYGALIVGWVILLAANLAKTGLCMIGWVLYIMYALHTAYVRQQVRLKQVRSRLERQTCGCATLLCASFTGNTSLQQGLGNR